jgi:hypothetical protein
MADTTGGAAHPNFQQKLGPVSISATPLFLSVTAIHDSLI